MSAETRLDLPKEPIDLEAIADLLAAKEVGERLREAEIVRLKMAPFMPVDAVYVLDPNDPFMVGDRSDEVWIACHPSLESEARFIAEAAGRADDLQETP